MTDTQRTTAREALEAFRHWAKFHIDWDCDERGDDLDKVLSFLKTAALQSQGAGATVEGGKVLREGFAVVPTPDDEYVSPDGSWQLHIHTTAEWARFGKGRQGRIAHVVIIEKPEPSNG